VLYRELVEGMRIATDVSASRLMQAEPGLFYVAATLHDGVTPDACEGAMLDILGGICDHGLSGDDLIRARNLTRVDGLLSVESCLGAAGTAAFWESLGSWSLEESYERGLDGADVDTITSAARRYLSPDGRSSAWLVR
jgi:hypothetical protein